jgi:hypothetical protein
MKQFHVKNWRVVIYSIIALGFIVLAALVNYWFLIGAVILVLINQRELMKYKREANKK